MNLKTDENLNPNKDYTRKSRRYYRKKQFNTAVILDRGRPYIYIPKALAVRESLTTGVFQYDQKAKKFLISITDDKKRINHLENIILELKFEQID